MYPIFQKNSWMYPYESSVAMLRVGDEFEDYNQLRWLLAAESARQNRSHAITRKDKFRFRADCCQNSCGFHMCAQRVLVAGTTTISLDDSASDFLQILSEEQLEYLKVWKITSANLRHSCDRADERQQGKKSTTFDAHMFVHDCISQVFSILIQSYFTKKIVVFI